MAEGNEEEINVRMVLEDLFTAKAKEVEKSFNGIEEQATKANKSMSLLTGWTVVRDVFSALKAVVSEAADVLGRISREAMEAEDAQVALANALQMTGASTEAVEMMSEYAEQLSRVTKYSDEAIKRTMAFISTMGVAPEQVARVTKAALDLSQALGIDVHTAAMRLTRTLEGQGNALSRWGIDVQTKGLTPAQKFAAVMDAVEQKVGGRAQQDAMGLFSAILSQVSNAFGEVVEVMGNWVIKSESLRTALKGLIDGAFYAARAIGSVQDTEFGDWLAGLIPSAKTVAAILLSIGAALARLRMAALAVAVPVKMVWDTLFAGAELVLQGVMTAVDLIGRAADAIMGNLKRLAGVSIGLLMDAMEGVAEAARVAGQHGVTAGTMLASGLEKAHGALAGIRLGLLNASSESGKWGDVLDGLDVDLQTQKNILDEWGKKIDASASSLQKGAASVLAYQRAIATLEGAGVPGAKTPEMPTFPVESTDEYLARLQAAAEPGFKLLADGVRRQGEDEKLIRQQNAFDTIRVMEEVGDEHDLELERELLALQGNYEERLKLAKEHVKKEKAVRGELVAANLSAYSDMLGGISALISDNGKKQTEFTKLLMVAETTMSGIAAGIRVWANPGWPLAVPLSIGIAARTLAAINQIRSVTYGGGGGGAGAAALSTGGAAGGGGGGGGGERGGPIGTTERSGRQTVTVEANINGLAVVTDQQGLGRAIAEALGAMRPFTVGEMA